MPCDRKLKPKQTISERAKEVREAVARLSQALIAGRVKVTLGPQNAIAFQGWDETSRDGVGDVCAYRILMSTGTAMARLALEEALGGRTVNKVAIGQGTHSHDGGRTWHSHKG